MSSAIAARVAAWRRLAEKPVGAKRLAIVLSNYPGRPHQIAHAVGLDALASVDALVPDLAEAGFDVAPVEVLGETLLKQTLSWSVAEYRAALSRLPQVLQDDLAQAWGVPEDDPSCRDGAFHFAAIASGRSIIAVQPERGDATTRDSDYHDLARTPRHAYVAFYLWLREQGIDAVVHMGAHGTLEWLPGKSVALSSSCWPEALIGDLPVIYPFIVNDPGEAAQAKRRIGAVAVGHLPPPLAASAVPEGLRRLERLLDEYSTADGLDPARRQRLIAAIRDEARAAGSSKTTLASRPRRRPRKQSLGSIVSSATSRKASSATVCTCSGAARVVRRSGMHCVPRWPDSALRPGPSGSPYRGRQDVLPTGRNLFAVDPRAVPTPSAHAQGIKLAEELLRRHLQDHGDWPKGLVVDLWGSATMRTAGEEFAMALHLAGLAPRWDHASGRVTGYDIIAPAELGRPRIDVTLRVSGLFRDHFGTSNFYAEAQAAVQAFEQADPIEAYADLLAFAKGFGKVHQENRPQEAWQPTKIKLGTDRSYLPGWLNIDAQASTQPDLLLDLSQPVSWPLQAETGQAGDIEIAPGSVDTIFASHALAQVPDLPTLMSNCLTMLKPQGRLIVEVPHEQAFSAWQDPTHVRAMNETSWLCFSDLFWRMGWFEHRFSVDFFEYLDDKNEKCAREQASFMRVALVKVETSPQERTLARMNRPDFALPDDLPDQIQLMQAYLAA
ncbi:MAG: cobaltochelatase subunit CobN [Aquabacterium sp.]